MDDTGRPGDDSRTVEAMLAELEQLLTQLEDENTPLETSFALYEKGMKLVKEINGKIDRVEKQMIVLEEREDG